MADSLPDGDDRDALRELITEALYQHTVRTALPTPFPPDCPEAEWLAAARRAARERADAVLAELEDSAALVGYHNRQAADGLEPPVPHEEVRQRLGMTDGNQLAAHGEGCRATWINAGPCDCGQRAPLPGDVPERTAEPGATSPHGMNELRDGFRHGRGDMLDAFAKLTTLARRAGIDEDAIRETHGQFFDGNVQVKRSFRVIALLAEAWQPLPGDVPEGDTRAEVIHLRDRIAADIAEWALRYPLCAFGIGAEGQDRDGYARVWAEQITDGAALTEGVMAIVAPVLDERDREIAQLRGELGACAEEYPPALAGRARELREVKAELEQWRATFGESALRDGLARMTRAERDEQRQRAEQAEALLRDLIDHYGQCQPRCWQGCGQRCPHFRAKVLLAALEPPATDPPEKP